MTATAVRRGKESEADIFPFDTQECQTFLSHQNLSVTFLGCFSLESAKAGKAVETQLSPVHCSFPFSYLAFLLHLFPQLHLDTPPPSSVSLTPRQGQQYLSSDAVLTVRPGLVEVQSELWLPCLFDSEKYPNYVKDWELMFSSCPPTRSCLIPLLLVRSPLLYFRLHTLLCEGALFIRSDSTHQNTEIYYDRKFWTEKRQSSRLVTLCENLVNRCGPIVTSSWRAWNKTFKKKTGYRFPKNPLLLEAKAI